MRRFIIQNRISTEFSQIKYFYSRKYVYYQIDVRGHIYKKGNSSPIEIICVRVYDK